MPVDGQLLLRLPPPGGSNVPLKVRSDFLPRFQPRLLVVRPPPEKLAKVAVRMAESRAFSVLVIDTTGALGDHDRVRSDEVGRWTTTVRRLSLAIEGSDRTIVMLTDLWAQRPMVLPVAMRIEIERPAADRLYVRVGKDRYGRVTSKTAVPLAESA